MSPAPRRRTAAVSASNPSVPLLVRTLLENYGGGAWHGPSVRQALRDLDARAARWRPAPGRHNIWEIVLHLAYARHRVIGRLTDRPRTRFPRALEAPWWPAVPVLGGDVEWSADMELLAELQRRLLETVEHIPAERLASLGRGRSVTYGIEVLGLATHDAYHAGQMQLIRRLSTQRS
ncbi:MAG TPA: DinB family protein, partial [Gemmatimonadaceae bacterium]